MLHTDGMPKVYSSTAAIRDTPFRELTKTIESHSRHNNSMERLDGGDRLNLSIDASDAKHSQGSPDYRDMYKNVQIKDMVNARRGRQYEGTVPNYSLPDQSAYLIKIHGQQDWKLQKANKSTYLTEIADRVKRFGGKNVAPGDYPYDKQPIEGKCTKRYLWDKEKRKTFLEEISIAEKSKKGPADYQNTQKFKIVGTYTLKTEKNQFMNEVAFLSRQTPSPTTYMPRHEVKSTLQRSPQANLNRCRSERPACLPFKKVDGPNPHSYSSVDKNWKRLSNFVESSQPFIFKKEKTSNYLDIVTKRKGFVPGVGKYDLDSKRVDRLSKGPQPRFKQGR